MNQNVDPKDPRDRRKAPVLKVASDFDHDAPATRAPEPAVLVVKEKPATGSSHLLPPLLIVLLGTGFLAYRSWAHNWRGLNGLIESAWTLEAPAVEPRALARADVPSPMPEPTPEPLDLESETPIAEEPEAVDPAGERVEEDIEAEAQKTRERIAELERLKEKEARDLAETADERREADRNTPKLPRFAFRGVPPGEIDKMIEAQRERLREQMAWMAQLHERQMKEMAEMQRRFLRDGFDSPNPDAPPLGFMFPAPFQGAPLLPRARAPRGGNPAGDRVIRTPDGGIARFREFQGPNGVRGFEWRWNPGQEGPAPRGQFFPDDDVPAPRAPQPKVRFD